MRRDLMEVKLLSVQTRHHARTWRLKDNEGHSMIFCNYQVRGAAGAEVLQPAAMVERVEREVRPGSLDQQNKDQTEQRKFLISL